MAFSPTSLFSELRVVEIASMILAPSASVLLADFGAEVIKIEPPVTGDLNRQWHKINGLPVSDMAYAFQVDNRNKKSVVLDLKNPKAYAAFCKIVADADVLITNYRLKALEKLKLDYETLHALNPNLVYALATGFGEKGREAHKPGYDTVSYWSRSGIEHQVFPFEGWLAQFPYGSGDHPSGMALFAAIMTGLYQRDKTGKGCKVSTSLLANGAWSNAVMLQAQLAGATFREKRPRDNAYNFISLHYPTADNRLLKMSMVNTEKNWQPFCHAIGRDDLPQDSRFCNNESRIANMPTLIKELTDTIGTFDIAEVTQKLEKADVPHTVVSNYEEAANDQQKEDNDIVVPFNHPEYGPMKTINSPFTVEGADKIPATAAPNLGQDTNEVLTKFGLSEEEISALDSVD
ncbi:MAG: CaiB/BaiF CoA transferase family protein [Pseudohongiellaceae bacterium]